MGLLECFINNTIVNGSFSMLSVFFGAWMCLLLLGINIFLFIPAVREIFSRTSTLDDRIYISNVLTTAINIINVSKPTCRLNVQCCYKF